MSCILPGYIISMCFNFFVFLYDVHHILLLLFFKLTYSYCNCRVLKFYGVFFIFYNVQRCDQFGIALNKCCVIINNNKTIGIGNFKGLFLKITPPEKLL